MKKCFETNANIFMALMQIRSTPICPRLPCPATLLFNRLTRDILPKFNRHPVLCNNDESNLISVLNDPKQAKT